MSKMDIHTCASQVTLLPASIHASNRLKFVSPLIVRITTLVSYFRIRQVPFLIRSQNNCIVNFRWGSAVLGISCRRQKRLLVVTAGASFVTFFSWKLKTTHVCRCLWRVFYPNSILPPHKSNFEPVAGTLPHNQWQQRNHSHSLCFDV